MLELFDISQDFYSLLLLGVVFLSQPSEHLHGVVYIFTVSEPGP